MFCSEVTIQQFYIELTKIPQRQIVKKTVYIRNLTEIDARYEMEVKNFPAKNIKPSKIDSVLYELKWKRRNELVEKLSEHGIVFVVKPHKGDVKGNDLIGIDIWIYAETWGVYLEEIGINLTDMPTFNFSILIEIQGMPIEYPIIKNTPMTQPVLR